MSSWAVNVRSGSAIARLPCNQRGSIGLSHGLFTGKRHTRIRTPPVRFTARLCAPIHARTARLTCQAALSHTSTHTRVPSAASRSAPQARKAVVTRLTGRPSTKRSSTRSWSVRNSPEPARALGCGSSFARALTLSRSVSPRRASSAGPSGSTRPHRHSPPPSRGGGPPSRSGGRASFFERILRVRAGDPGLRPPPADPQPLERVADGLQADPLGRDPVLGADLGGQGQGPGGAGLAELPRALVQERLQPLAALGI